MGAILTRTQHEGPHDTGAHVVSTPDLVRIVSIMHVIY